MKRNSPDGLSRYTRFDETTSWVFKSLSFMPIHPTKSSTQFAFFDLHLSVSPDLDSFERLSDAMAKYHLEISTRREDAMSELISTGPSSVYKMGYRRYNSRYYVCDVEACWRYNQQCTATRKYQWAVFVLNHPCCCGKFDPYAYVPYDA